MEESKDLEERVQNLEVITCNIEDCFLRGCTYWCYLHQENKK